MIIISTLPKRILHLTNAEEKIPHLMGLQYIGAEKFTGDSGAYLIKKERLKRKAIEVMTRKLYRKETLRDSIQSIIYGKIDNIDKIKEMFSNASVLYLYDTKKNREQKKRTVDMLDDSDALLAECKDKREEALVKDFLKLWR